ncbi:MAG: diadenylate cyclase [Pseudomonadota bacterium]
MDSLAAFFEALRWQDSVDIMLNSYILFRLYLLFRGTAVLRVLIGIALLLCAQRAAVFLGLVLTSWVIQGITAAAALIIIVIFRNEIRSVLQARNLKTIFWGSPLKKITTPIETIVASVYDLAQKRCGALLVVPGRDDIRDFIHSGTALNGLISKEMILSIFWKDNPVHDGAVIIQGDRITDVGAVLPLSQRSDLPSQYGTRHRAAAGLAGVTDALVIVVSEERGSITAVKDGQIYTIHRKEELSGILKKHLLHYDEKQQYRKKEKRYLAIAALASFLLVIFVWFGFTKGTDTLINLEVPVEYINRGSSFDIFDSSVNTIRLQLSGSDTLIKSVQPEQVHVRLDLSKGTAGRNSFTITAEQIKLPPGIFVKKAEPPAVDVILDTHALKELPLQVDWVGKLHENALLAACEINPDKITVTGGSRLLEKISTLYTEKISLDAITQGGSITAAIVLNPPSLKIVSGPDKISIQYVIKERDRSKF